MFDRMTSGNQGPADPPALRREIERAMNGLAEVTAAHDGTWHLGEADWSLDQDDGNLVFTTPQGLRAVAPAQIIGTYNTRDGTWLWGWDHPSIQPPLARDAKAVLAYGRQHGYERLTTRKLQCTEAEAWELTGLAFMLCDANGAYRGPAGTALVFMTFGDVKLSQAT
jgi:uncharacterized protein DUF6882